jgi:hypothetical protein
MYRTNFIRSHNASDIVLRKCRGSHRRLRISPRPTEKGSQSKREVASVQVYHDGCWSTPRQSAGMIVVECVIKDFTDLITRLLQFLNIESTLWDQVSYLTPVLRINYVIRCRNHTLPFLECSWESSAHNNFGSH